MTRVHIGTHVALALIKSNADSELEVDGTWGDPAPVELYARWASIGDKGGTEVEIRVGGHDASIPLLVDHRPVNGYVILYDGEVQWWTLFGWMPQPGQTVTLGFQGTDGPAPPTVPPWGTTAAGRTRLAGGQ